MANQNNNSNNNNNNSNNNSTNSSNTNNSNNTNSHQQHTLSIHHGLNNTSPLIISSSQLLSSMPSLAVAAAAAGITTTLIPLSNDLTASSSSTNNTSTSQTSSNGTSNSTGTATASSSTSSSAGGAAASASLSNSNTGLLDLIMCKLVAPFHVVNDPRLLECGSSACFQCIMSSKDNERNLKCPYCNNIHKIPIDINKIVVNKNLQNFLKINFRQINQQGFSKQLEDSMFALEQKIHSQNLSMENFDQYLTLIQNDVQMKVETMKNHLEKYGEQFIENLKLIRKEVQKNFQTCCNEYESRFNVYRQWIEHSNNNNNTNNTQTASATATLNNVVQQQQLQQLQQQHQQQQQQQQQLQQQQHQVGKEKTFQLIGIKGEPLLQLQSNPNIMTLLGNPNNNGVNHSTYQLSSFHNPTSIQTTNASTNSSTGASSSSGSGASSAASSNSNNNHHSNNTSSNNLNQHNDNNNTKQRNTNHNANNSNNDNNSIINSAKSNLLQHTSDTLNTSLDVLQNTFNFSNSSSWNANDDDLDDFDTDLNLKPVQASGNSSGNGQKRHLNKEQAQFNKFVREEVSKKFGEDFLLQHEVNQLESSIMELIKTEAIATFLPKDTTPARAWTLAKVSLRSLKRDLRRKQGISLKKETQECKIVNHPYYDV